MSTHRTYPRSAPTRPIPLRPVTTEPFPALVASRPVVPGQHRAGRTWASRAVRVLELSPLMLIAPVPLGAGAWAAAEVVTAVIGWGWP